MKNLILALLFFVVLPQSNASAQWLQSNFGMPNYQDTGTSVYAFAELDTLLFAATSRGVFTSRDHGYHWLAQHWGLDPNYVYRDRSNFPSWDIMVLIHRYALDHPKWLWAHQANNFTYLDDSLSGAGVAIDPQGNAIVAANLGGSVYLDDTILRAPTGALVIIKYDTNGTIRWIKMSRTPHGNVRYTSVACDSLGNIYAAGLLGPSWDGTTPSVEFGATLSSGATSGPFLVSYDSNGRFRWVGAPTGSTASAVQNVWVQADSAGNAYLAGTFSGDLYAGAISTILLKTPQEEDFQDLFLAKYNSGSNPSWIIQSSSKGHLNYESHATCSGLCIDAPGNCYLLGNSIDTEFIAGQMITGQGMEFVTKYDTKGKGIWLVPFAGSSPTDPFGGFSSISCDRAGNLAVCGTCEEDKVTFNNNTYNTNASASGWTSGILAALDSSGATRWFKATTLPWGQAEQVCVSGIGNVFVNTPGTAAQTFDSVSFSGRNYNQDNSGITKLQSNGTVEWAFHDGMSGLLAANRDQSLYALWAPTQVMLRNGSGRFGRLGWMGSMALAKLSAEAPGETIDTDLYALGQGYFRGAGTIVSVDKGRSWLDLGAGGYELGVLGTTLLSGGERSTDYGETWSGSGGPEYFHVIGNRIDGWNTSGSGSYSTDTGATWTTNSCRKGLGMEVSVGNRAFAEGGGMTNDSGRSWIATTVGIGGSDGQYGYVGDNFDSKAIGVANGILFDGSGQLSASTNWGETWCSVGSGLPDSVLSIHQYGSDVLVGLKDAGVWRRSISEIPPLLPNMLPVFEWAQQFHSYADASGEALAIDSSGNSVVFGSFEGSLTIGTQTLVHKPLAAGDRDYYLAKFDPKGNALWATQFEGGGILDSIRMPSLAIAPSGDIYVGANFVNAFTAGTFKLKGNPWQPQMCLIKCDANGVVVWLDSVANASTGTWLGAIAAARSGDVVITGQAAVKTSIGGIPLPDNVNDQGSFIALFAPDGTVKWAKRILPSVTNSFPKGIAIGADNNYYVGGAWRNGYWVVKGAGLFLEEYSSTGTLMDTVFAGNSDEDSILALSADAAGNIYALGVLSDSLTLGNTTLKRGNVQHDPRFLAQFKNGQWNWAETIGFQNYMYFREPIVGPPCRMTTAFDGTTYVIGLDSVFEQNSTERAQGINYVTQFNSSGARRWTKQINNGYSCDPMAIAADNSGSIWTTGSLLLPRYQVPGWPESCSDMAFGLIGLAVTNADSNLQRPFLTRLGGAGAPMAGVETPLEYPAQRTVVARLYPNPVGASATLQLHLDQVEVINIAIYDPLGNTVKKVMSAKLQPGDFEQTFSCSDLPDGTYFLCVQSSRGKSVIPMTILR